MRAEGPVLRFGRPSAVTSLRWTTCSSCRRSTKVEKRPPRIWPSGRTRARTRAGAMGDKESKLIVGLRVAVRAWFYAGLSGSMQGTIRSRRVRGSRAAQGGGFSAFGVVSRRVSAWGRPSIRVSGNAATIAARNTRLRNSESRRRGPRVDSSSSSSPGTLTNACPESRLSQPTSSPRQVRACSSTLTRTDSTPAPSLSRDRFLPSGLPHNQTPCSRQQNLRRG